MKLQNVFGILVLWAVALGLRAQTPSTVSVDVIGEGQPIVFIHGMSCSADVWDDVVAKYQTDFELHLVQIDGFGNKRTIEADHILEQVKDDLISYIDQSTSSAPIIMGHSMGGFLGFWIASERPDLVKGLISIDGLPYIPVLQMPHVTPESAKEMADNMRAMSAGQTEAMRRQMSEMMIATMIASEDRREEVIKMGMASQFDVVDQAYAEMLTTDLRPMVSQIKCPVLVLGAWKAYKQYGLTKEVNQMNYEAQVKSIENAEVRMADEAYHFIFFDEPEWFFQQTNHFLTELNNVK